MHYYSEVHTDQVDVTINCEMCIVAVTRMLISAWNSTSSFVISVSWAFIMFDAFILKIKKIILKMTHKAFISTHQNMPFDLFCNMTVDHGVFHLVERKILSIHEILRHLEQYIDVIETRRHDELNPKITAVERRTFTMPYSIQDEPNWIFASLWYLK